MLAVCDNSDCLSMTDSEKAVVLLSGGLDSATALAIAGSQGFRLFALSFDYGQRHSIETRSAAQVAKSLRAERHLTIDVNLRAIGASALTDQIDVPKERSAEEISTGIPVTYVPARNTIFLSFALAWAEVLGAQDIFIGVNALDYSGYPDCRRLKIHTPLIAMTKAEIIVTGLKLGVDYSLTHSCYDPSSEGISCGKCDSCLLRLKGFAQAGVRDPLSYAER